MAADVTTLVRIMEAYKEELKVKRRGLFTRDLLDGGDGAASAGIRFSMELDLDFQVPAGWERRLDLMSGTMYLHRLDSDLPPDELCDLNLPPPAASLPEDSALLDLKLSGGGISGAYQSVCTLDKVKSALKRAVGKDQPSATEEGNSCASASPPSSTSSSSVKRWGLAERVVGGFDANGGMMAAACPRCLLYVLISKGKPRCPRCDSHVPDPLILKKPRIDLNSS
ncbi:hypothetical protein KSP39_PZI000353 [Platanthera zijinensis]|uniref:GIR1-like zinc ribbon domain-containing protein n=1 Tax=Platanthera zijinensis TaxID=2320716 RepID=A0AAP0GF29_9ASPA